MMGAMRTRTSLLSSVGVKGARFELELFLPDRKTVTCKVEVVWTERLPAGSPSNYDVGLKFIEVDLPKAFSRLDDLLAQEET